MSDSLKQAKILLDIDRLSLKAQQAFSALTMRRPVCVQDASRAAGLDAEDFVAGLDEMVKAGLISYEIADGIVSVSWLEV